VEEDGDWEGFVPGIYLTLSGWIGSIDCRSPTYAP
jgi:hypothetical protein